MILKIFWERSNRSWSFMARCWSGPYDQWSSMWSKSEFRYSLVYHNGEI